MLFSYFVNGFFDAFYFARGGTVITKLFDFEYFNITANAFAYAVLDFFVCNLVLLFYENYGKFIIYILRLNGFWYLLLSQSK